jgi:hypothetical protein
MFVFPFILIIYVGASQTSFFIKVAVPSLLQTLKFGEKSIINIKNLSRITIKDEFKD